MVAGALLVVLFGSLTAALIAMAADKPESVPAALKPTAFLPMLQMTEAPKPQNPLRSGKATYYAATGSGNCSFDPSPNDLMVAAISHEDYAVAAYCGAYVEVFGPSGSVVVRIVDKCPDAQCTTGHLDLSRQAFAKIAPLERGIVPITWRVVSPTLSGPIAYHFKEGSNQWWTAVQIRNHRNPIVRLEWRNAAGAWVAAERTDYNYFVQTNPGMGPGPYTFRVTDSYGNIVEDRGIAFRENGTVTGAAQFPAGP
jgi:expansin (peptidoglycan-binding protein)